MTSIGRRRASPIKGNERRIYMDGQDEQDGCGFVTKRELPS